MAIERKLQSPSEDFASAAMMRLVHAGLRKLGIAPQYDRPSGAHVPFQAKRAVLQDIYAAHGPVAILRIADAIPELPPEPLLQALLLARSLEDLLDRWSRIAAFSHKLHRIEAERLAPGKVVLRHRSRVEGADPNQVETLLVMGVLTVLSETALNAPSTVLLGDQTVLRENGSWAEPAVSSAIGSWLLTCRAHDADQRPAPTPEDDLPIEHLRDQLRSDPVRRWKIGELARETGVSVRSLQRRLAEQSMSFSTLVSDTRLEIAANQLCASGGPSLSEIGFLSGYSDQAHFTRSFKGSVGTTPSAYRAEFQARA